MFRQPSSSQMYCEILPHLIALKYWGNNILAFFLCHNSCLKSGLYYTSVLCSALLYYPKETQRALFHVYFAFSFFGSLEHKDNILRYSIKFTEFFQVYYSYQSPWRARKNCCITIFNCLIIALLINLMSCWNTLLTRQMSFPPESKIANKKEWPIR